MHQSSTLDSCGELLDLRLALAANQEFPFLHDFSYRTLGWRWNLVRILPDLDQRQKLGPVLEALLQTFFCSAVECSTGDLTVTFAPETGHLRVIDSTPGGNGLSEALLLDSRTPEALALLAKAVRSYLKRPAKFKTFLAVECQLDSAVPVDEVIDAVERLACAWSG